MNRRCTAWLLVLIASLWLTQAGAAQAQAGPARPAITVYADPG